MCMPERRLIHCAASVVVRESIVTVYDNCFTWRLVTYVRRRNSSTPRSSHDVAGPSINMDLCEAEVCSEASLGAKLEAQMWRHTLAQLRNSQRLEKWLVAVELIQT